MHYEAEIDKADYKANCISHQVTEQLEKENEVRKLHGKQLLQIPKYYPCHEAIDLDMKNTNKMLLKEINTCFE